MYTCTPGLILCTPKIPEAYTECTPLRLDTRPSSRFLLKIPNKADPELGSEKYYSFFAHGMESRRRTVGRTVAELLGFCAFCTICNDFCCKSCCVCLLVTCVRHVRGWRTRRVRSKKFLKSPLPPGK